MDLILNLISNYAVQRAIVAGFSFGSVLLGAKVVPSEDFSLILQTMFLAKFLQITNLGMTSGYFVSRYSGSGPLAQGTPDQEISYSVSLILQLTLISAILILGAMIFWPGYVAGIVAFLTLAPIVVLEPLFRFRRIFFFSLIPDALLALSLCILISILLVSEEAGSTVSYSLLLCLGTGVVLVMLWIRIRKSVELKSIRPFNLSSHYATLRSGFPVYLATALFMLASSADRLFLPLHGSSDEIARYFLGYQLTIGSMLFLASSNFINVVDLGESHKSGGKLTTRVIFEKLGYALLLALCSLIALGTVSTLIEWYFLGQDYEGLALSTIILGMGMASFYISGTITPVLAYLKKQMPVTFAMALVGLALLANNLAAIQFNLSALWLAGGTALCFGIFSLSAIAYTVHAVANHSESGFAQD